MAASFIGCTEYIPSASKVGQLILALTENFYNFGSLIGSRDNFDPDWQPRYMAFAGSSIRFFWREITDGSAPINNTAKAYA